MQIRKQVADYNLYHSIGKGSFGEVVLAEKKEQMGIFYACKVIKLGDDSEAAKQERASIAQEI